MNQTLIVLLGLQGGFNLLLIVALAVVARRVPRVAALPTQASGFTAATVGRRAPQDGKLEPHLDEILARTRDTGLPSGRASSLPARSVQGRPRRKGVAASGKGRFVRGSGVPPARTVAPDSALPTARTGLFDPAEETGRAAPLDAGVQARRKGPFDRQDGAAQRGPTSRQATRRQGPGAGWGPLVSGEETLSRTLGALRQRVRMAGAAS